MFVCGIIDETEEEYFHMAFMDFDNCKIFPTLLNYLFTKKLLFAVAIEYLCSPG